MKQNTIITCAITGADDTPKKNPHVPVSPSEIAAAAIEAAKAGAAIVHIHVRDPDTGTASRQVSLYEEVVERIRSSETDVIINLTAGMGGDLYFGPDTDPMNFAKGTDLVGGMERLPHVEKLLPEICTLDCGSLNFGNSNLVYVSTPDMLRIGAKRIQELGVKPELEVFDTGHLAFVKQLITEGLIDTPPMIQLCLGIPWGAPADTTTMKAMTDSLPDKAKWSAFGIGRTQMPMVAQAALLGGNVRVGLEDNLYLEAGVLATNAQLVERARKIIELMGGGIASPSEARTALELPTMIK